jgi:hypothetical protein
LLLRCALMAGPGAQAEVLTPPGRGVVDSKRAAQFGEKIGLPGTARMISRDQGSRFRCVSFTASARRA